MRCKTGDKVYVHPDNEWGVYTEGKVYIVEYVGDNGNCDIVDDRGTDLWINKRHVTPALTTPREKIEAMLLA
jgi:hypothetical protein